MDKNYHIIEICKMGKYKDFDDAILVKVIPADFIDEFSRLNPNDINDEEEYNQLQDWLVFKNYPGKMRWLSQKQAKCDEGNYWSLDFDDFVNRLTSFTDKTTGQGFVRPLKQVIMVEAEMDVVEAKEFGVKYSGRTGSQKILDELGFELVGKGNQKYYLISGLEDLPKEKFDPEHDVRFWNVFGEEMVSRWRAFAIPYNCSEALGGLFQVDRIVLCMDGDGENDLAVVRIENENYGIYNYLTKQLFGYCR